MTRNLDEEYVNGYTIYESQRKYRKSEAGKASSRRTVERRRLRQMCQISDIVKCNRCDETKFERLLINNNEISCYSCKFERPPIFEEIRVGEL